MKNWGYVILAIMYTALDQITKYWSSHHLYYQEKITIIPDWFDVTLVHNKGVAFSMFSEASNWINYVIFSLAMFICAYMLYYTFTNQFNPIQKVSASLVIGGAVGNIIDRCIHGYVIDFLFFHHNNFTWPVFNLADSFITIGAVIFIFEGWIQQRKVHTT